MASDCTVAIDNGYINMRVGAIIMKGNKFLMVGNQKDEYLYSKSGCQVLESRHDEYCR